MLIGAELIGADGLVRSAVRAVGALGAAAVVLAGCASDPEGGARTPPPLPATAPDGSPAAGPTAAAPGRPRTLATGLRTPWAIAFLPDGDALVTERDTARLLRVTPQGRVTPIGEVPGVRPGGEGGLLGVAVSPSYERDRRVYLYFTAADDNRVVRFRFDGRSLSEPRPIVTGIPKGANHNGGRIAFGPDGLLYVATGEVYRTELAQDRGSLGGKILRVTPDGGPAPGNPFASPVWSYGHRNVQGLAWDERGRLYATEFGQNRFDEINLIERGRNYGWPHVEGVQRGDDEGRYTDPLLTWTTDEASPSGLAYASGSLWAAGLRGRRLWQIPLAPDGRVGRPIAHYEGEYGRLRAVVRAPDGSLWITTSNHDGRGTPSAQDDRILRVPL
ncbi:PQQ-dependent sugar dehydrogenase [Thermomonospora catenispora]|uniref:PQQ-dependent sugar dehydrogenase n=1 Tax=Thermomonospora catenispora TaxID=2493090 RepID=UPI0011245ED1|nr:PQQ-dependent sugar dehydrogenase [Thermomonospora catenispora]TNY38569.1 PQQ-dependent sugar dehydrogenase [Thermomonospora catenispora]